MEKDKTTVVDVKKIESQNIKSTLKEICLDLEDRGYNAQKQIVAYLVSGDPGYISSYKECRNRILKYKREDILEVMLVNFLEK